MTARPIARILVPIDFSPTAGAALTYAKMLRRHTARASGIRGCTGRCSRRRASGCHRIARAAEATRSAWPGVGRDLGLISGDLLTDFSTRGKCEIVPSTIEIVRIRHAVCARGSAHTPTTRRLW
jgi:hypothetical protein